MRNHKIPLGGAALALVLLTGCSSSSTDINAPLPRSSRSRAAAKAAALAHAAAGAAGRRPSRPTSDTDFSDCVGRHDEVAHDGRFVYSYTVDIDAPVSQHNAVGERIRTYMKQHKFGDVTWQPARSKSEEMALHGYAGDWSVAVGSTVGDHGPNPVIYIAVTTPCLLPPGAEQQKF